MTPLRLAGMVLGLWLFAGTVLASTVVQPLWTYRATAPEGYSVAISADGSSIAACLDRIYFFTRSGEKVWGGFGGKAVSITGDGSVIAAGTDAGIRVLDSRGRTLWLDSDVKPVDTISMSPEGRFVATIGGTTFSLHTNAGFLLARNSTYGATAVAIPTDSSIIAVGTPNSVVGFNQSGSEKWRYGTFENRKLLFARDGTYLIGASAYSVVALHPSGNLLWSYRTGSNLRDIAVSSDSRYIVAGSDDRKVYLFNRTGGLLWIHDLGDPVACVDISGNGSFITAGSGRGLDRRIYLFTSAGDLAWSYQAKGWVTDVALSEDGTSLAAVSDDGVLAFFRTAGAPVTPPATTVPAEAITTLAPPATSPPAGTQPTTEAQPTTSGPEPGPTRAGGTSLLPAALAALAAGILIRVKEPGR
ncbi:MAG: DUF5711 family protein [Methanomicrobiales archaeon]|nr:DUF5711 family protein [Methanomicrobiales archaeon]